MEQSGYTTNFLNIDDGLAISIKRRMTMVELLVTPKSITHMETLIEKVQMHLLLVNKNLV